MSARLAMTPFVYDDGGRAEAGYHGETGDCVVRAIAIATERSYQEVYDAINDAAQGERCRGRRRGRKSSARLGVYKETYRRYLESLGWQFVPTMGIGTGCRVHLRTDELPGGRIIASLSKHLVAVIDGTVHDTSDPSRGGTRCVYGYFSKEADNA